MTTNTGASSPSLTFLSGQASRVLDLCQQLRHLDTAVHAIRGELAEVGRLIDTVNPFVETPETLLRRLRALSWRICDLEERRRQIREELDPLIS
jgi:hypothetical protein